jgi:hypothetical protein
MKLAAAGSSSACRKLQIKRRREVHIAGLRLAIHPGRFID